MSGWPPKDWRALLALIFSVAGAVVLSLFVWWGVAQLLPASDGWSKETEAGRLYTIRWILWISTGSIGAVLIGLGMAINRRSFKANVGGSGFDFQGGDGPDPVTDAAKDTARAAADEARHIAADRGRMIPDVEFGMEKP